MPQSSPHPRNHTARIGRLIAAVDSIRAQHTELVTMVRGILRNTERNPITRVQQLIAEYELETGEKPHPLLRQAIEHLGDHYNGFLGLVEDYGPPIEAIEVIVEERTWWNTTHKRNAYNANAQAKRRANLAGEREISQDDIDAANAERGIPPANPQPWTDEELRGDSVWSRARRRDAERDAAAAEPEPTATAPTDDEIQETPQATTDVGRAQYERDRAERQSTEEAARSKRTSGPLCGKS